MNLSNVARIRLATQQITGTTFKTAKDIVAWMGAMQAQDYPMAKWAVGVRLRNTTDQLVETAINNGEIIRTHLLRPTWHLVPAEDIYWMLALTAPQIKTLTKTRHKDLELSTDVFRKSNAILEKALRDGKHLTREEVVAEFKKAKIATHDNRASHIILEAELDGLVCSGATKAGKQTYALLEEWVPKKKSLSREEALASLAKKYFVSHGPATLQDFVWWSGLSVSAARHALEMVKTDLISETIASQTYWLTGAFSIPRAGKARVHLLPAYDEFIISYRDRSASLPVEHQHLSVSDNGIFRPTIVLNGQVLGLWKRTIKKNQAFVETKFFDPPGAAINKLVEKAFDDYGRFLGKEIVGHV